MIFRGKAVLITGSSRGIGKATAKEFLASGARVASNGRTEDSVAHAIEELGGHESLVAAPGDVATAAGCETLVGAAVEALGGLDVLVNSAGVYTQTDFHISGILCSNRIVLRDYPFRFLRRGLLSRPDRIR